MNPDLSFSWYRVNSSDTSSCVPIFTPSLSPENGWYPPSADDIGHVIRVKCKDKLDLGVLRCIDSQPIPVDKDLAAKVEEAVAKDRIWAKAVVCSSRLYFSRLRANAVSKGTLPRNHKTLSRSGSTGSANGATGTGEAADKSDDNGRSKSQQYHVVDIPDFEVAGSIEVGSKGILICEKGVECGGLRFYPSSQMEVTCCQSASIVLRVPLVDVSEGHPPVAVAGVSATSHQEMSSEITTSALRLIEWVGSEEGDMYDSLCDVLTDEGGGDRSRSSIESSTSDRCAHNVEAGHCRAHSAGSISSNSYDDVLRKPSPVPVPSSSPPANTMAGRPSTHQRRHSASSTDFSSCTASAPPARLLELVISCRDRLIRDSVVLGLKAMVINDPLETGPLHGVDKVQRHLSRLPWHQVDYATRSGDAEGGELKEGDASKKQLRRDVDRLQGEVLAACAAREEMRLSLAQALAGKEEAEGRVLSLQQELSLLRQGEGEEGGEKSAAKMAADMADMQEVCRGLHSKLHAAEATIAELTDLVSTPYAQQPVPIMPTTASTMVDIPKNDSVVSSSFSPEAALRRHSDELQSEVVFPVYEAYSGEEFLPLSPQESMAGTSHSKSPISMPLRMGGQGHDNSMYDMEEFIATLKSKVQGLRECEDATPAEASRGDAREDTDIAGERARFLHHIEELLTGLAGMSRGTQSTVGFVRECRCCGERGTSNSIYNTPNGTLSASGMDESKYSFRQEGGGERQHESDRSPSVDLVSPLVAISSSLQALLTSLSVERSTSGTDEATIRNYFDFEDARDNSGPAIARTLRVIEVIQSQVEKLCTSSPQRLPTATSDIHTQAACPVALSNGGIAERKTRGTTNAGKTGFVNGGGDPARTDQDCDDNVEHLDGDEGFASVSLVTLEGAPLDDNEVSITANLRV